MNTCVFCGKEVDEDNSIPSFWVDDVEYCEYGQCVCCDCVKQHLSFDEDDQVHFLPSSEGLPPAAKVFMP